MLKIGDPAPNIPVNALGYRKNFNGDLLYSPLDTRGHEIINDGYYITDIKNGFFTYGCSVVWFKLEDCLPSNPSKTIRITVDSIEGI